MMWQNASIFGMYLFPHRVCTAARCVVTGQAAERSRPGYAGTASAGSSPASSR
jgi:hypothetical protein